MVWYSLKLGRDLVKYTPLKPIEEKLPLCDSSGKEVFKFAKSHAEYGYRYADGTEYTGEILRLDNGVAIGKYTKTKEIPEGQFKFVDKLEAFDLIAEHWYKCELNDYLARELTDKAVKFKFTNGNGYKEYFGYITSFGQHFVMLLGTQKISLMLNSVDVPKELPKKAIAVKTSRLEL
mgnify:FL=1